jgi:gamma-glutamyltranspeptidase/glutathione hydrolase
MSPTIILKDGAPIMTIGAAGGPTIISQTVLGIVNQIDFGMTVSAALAEPRFHHQWSPDELAIEERLPATVAGDLERRGHRIKRRSTIGVSQAIRRGADGVLHGASDPRVPGKAAGFPRREAATQLDPAAAA